MQAATSLSSSVAPAPGAAATAGASDPSATGGDVFAGALAALMAALTPQTAVATAKAIGLKAAGDLSPDKASDSDPAATASIIPTPLALAAALPALFVLPPAPTAKADNAAPTATSATVDGWATGKIDPSVAQPSPEAAPKSPLAPTTSTALAQILGAADPSTAILDATATVPAETPASTPATIAAPTVSPPAANGAAASDTAPPPIPALDTDPSLVRFIARAAAPSVAPVTAPKTALTLQATPAAPTATDPSAKASADRLASPPSPEPATTQATTPTPVPSTPPAAPFTPAASTQVAATATAPTPAPAPAAKPTAKVDVKPDASAKPLAETAAAAPVATQTAAAVKPATGLDVDPGPHDNAPAPAPAAETPSADAPADPSSAASAPAPTAAAATPADFAAAHGPQLVRQIADQIAKAEPAKTSHFDIQLDPAGLGRVNVRVAIDASGQLTAQLSFDNPAAAAEARSRSAELQQTLAQAGLDVSQNSLSFGTSGQGAGQAWQDGGGSAGRSFASTPIADDTTADPAPSPPSPVRTGSSGLDITI